MTHYSFLNSFMELQNDVIFNSLTSYPFAKLSHCAKDPSFYWNLALTNKVLSMDDIHFLEAEFSKRKRNSTITFENTVRLKPLAQILKKLHYKKVFTDSWLFYEGKEIDSAQLPMVKKVDDEGELAVFLSVFNDCYRKDDPQNPYGELGDYLLAAKDTWLKHHISNRIQYYLVYQGATPVAVSTLNSYNNIGYISNVGSLKYVRGKGFGKAATLFSVSESHKRGNDVTCLATEEGTYPHEFYKRIGFIKKLSTYGYTKEL